MREIKFRAWNTRENKMLYRKLFEMNWYETDKNDASGCHTWGAISGGQSRFLEVMQYTGLKDKNGKEIYEGDILDLTQQFDDYEMYGEVMWGDEEAMWLCLKKDGDDTEQGELSSYIDKRTQIIGNIYENPDLLTKRD